MSRLRLSKLTSSIKIYPTNVKTRTATAVEDSDVEDLGGALKRQRLSSSAPEVRKSSAGKAGLAAGNTELMGDASDDEQMANADDEEDREDSPMRSDSKDEKTGSGGQRDEYVDEDEDMENRGSDSDDEEEQVTLAMI